MEAGNTNAEAFRDCLYALEVRQWMIMKAIDTLFPGGVDWKALEGEYRKFFDEENQDKKGPAEHPEEAVIFGG